MTIGENHDDEVAHLRGEYQEQRNGLLARLIDSWRDMRGATRRLIEENPSEARLLFYVLMSDMVFFLSWALKTIVAPTQVFKDMFKGDAIEANLVIGSMLIAALFLRTTVVYIFSAILGAVLRAIGGKGSWKDTRTGIFWGSFVAAPFGLLMAIVTVIFSGLEENIPFLGNSLIAQIPYWLSLLPFVWLCSLGAAEAHGFKRSAPLFMGMTLLTMVVWFGALVLQARGVF
ncbi:MAG: YIP1 family protein [Paracoccaceae bacterium]